ncbi:MAG: thiamine-phosphate kinase [Candidatus Omnitrophica bacterium]|nr:thiamine-phosphate kinase [Candidatus Omnitrophota bacterium]
MKSIGQIGEFGLIERIRKKIKSSRDIILGAGDDAAVMRPPQGYELVTTDALVDGVDFELGKTPARLVGRKLLAINLSDIAAMAGLPKYAVVSMGLVARLSIQWVDEFLSGLLDMAKKYHVALVGGDISRAKELWASLALAGETGPGRQWVGRGGAKPGDAIFVTGALGGSISGKHLRFEPRIKEARWLARRFYPTSMIDISDGFLQDIGHILSQSGVGAEIYAGQIPVSRAAKTLSKQFKKGKSPLEHALTDGEDFELIFTVSEKISRKIPKQVHGTPLWRVGKILKEKQLILFESEKRDKKINISKKGFQHF